MTIKLLVIEKHPVVLAGLRHFLAQTPEISIAGEAQTTEESFQVYSQINPDVVIMDLSPADDFAAETVQSILRLDPNAKILVFSVFDNIMMLVRARELGVKGLINKSASADHIIKAIKTLAAGDTFFEDVDKPGRSSVGWGVNLLTPREYEIFRYLAEGYTVVQIADMLSSSPKTVGVHQTRIIKKLGVENSAQLAHLALSGGIIKLQPIQPSTEEQSANARLVERRMMKRRLNG